MNESYEQNYKNYNIDDIHMKKFNSFRATIQRIHKSHYKLTLQINLITNEETTTRNYNKNIKFI